jgi:hypothetical protein
MPAELDLYQGQARRLCPECGLEIVVQKPTRVLGKESSPSWRRAVRKELARQILWEGTCESCRSWWNRTLRRIEEGPDAMKRNAGVR